MSFCINVLKTELDKNQHSKNRRKGKQFEAFLMKSSLQVYISKVLL